MSLSAQRANPPVSLTNYRFPVTSTAVIYKGAAVGIETAAGATQGQLAPMGTSATQIYVGTAKENTKAVAEAGQYCNVDMGTEVWANWYKNATAPNAVASTDVGGVCYFTDDYTVSITGTSNSLAGRIWAVDSSKGVLVQKVTGTTLTATANIAAAGVAPGTAYQVLHTNAGATASEWSQDPDSYAAINATDDVTIDVTQGRKRKITACGDGKNVTVGTTGARAGHTIDIARPAIGASSACNIVNGGTGAGTLLAMTSNKKAGCRLLFDGTDWVVVANYQAT